MIPHYEGVDIDFLVFCFDACWGVCFIILSYVPMSIPMSYVVCLFNVFGLLF
jgi:hypothetical protein